jgi:hypothetical protein
MASHYDMSDLLANLAKYDEYESNSSCCTSNSSPTFSPHSWSLDCNHEVESGMADTLFCQCDNEDALVECLSCELLFKLDSFCLGC